MAATVKPVDVPERGFGAAAALKLARHGDRPPRPRTRQGAHSPNGASKGRLAGLTHQLHIQPRFGQQSRALIVHGHATARSMLAAQLRSLGVGQVLHCGSAGDARKHIDKLGVDVLLCEHRLEGGTLGQELIDELRRAKLLSLATVVIMLSGEASRRVVAEVAESALDGSVIKPYAAGQLEDRLIGAFLRKESLKEIFDAVDTERYGDGLALCEARFHARGPFWTHAARIGAELAIRLERLPPASALYAAVLADKAVPWAKLGLARVLDAGGQGAEAVSTIQNLLADEPTYADAYDVMGKIYAEQGDFAGAINAFRQASEITPFSLVRAQKYGILAYCAGDPEAALAALQHAADLGGDLAAFDHQTLLLLAMGHYQRGDAAGLTQCRSRLDLAVGKLPVGAQPDARAERLQRLACMAGALVALQDHDRPALHNRLADVADDLLAPGFDVEAATNLLSLIATSDAAGLPVVDGAAWARGAGLRFCISKQVTEVLVKACDPAPRHAELVRAAHTEIGEISRTALSEGLAGDHRRAVEQLLTAVARTRNAKFLELAGATLARHKDRIDDAEPLQQRCDELRRQCGLSGRTHLLSDEADRPAGGMALGLGRGKPGRRNTA